MNKRREIPEEVTCRDCLRLLPISMFYVRQATEKRAAWLARGSFCKDCYRVKDREYQRKLRADQRLLGKKRKSGTKKLAVPQPKDPVIVRRLNKIPVEIYVEGVCRLLQGKYRL